MPMPAVSSIRSVVESAIQRASSATGVDFTFLMGTAKRESGFNPAAKARTSSASGLFQFVDQTWLSTLKKHGSKYGYARYADLISQGSDGRYRVEGDEARKAVLGLKADPHAASLMAGELTSDHASYLRGRVGRDPTSGELYAAHFLGPAGSARLIQAATASPGASAAGLGQVGVDLAHRGGATRVTEQPDTVKLPEGDQGFMQYAGGRRLERIRQQEAMVDLILRGSQDVGNPFGGSDNSSSMGGGQRLASSMFSAEMLRVLADANDKIKR
jgi:hypothetical protein